MSTPERRPTMEELEIELAWDVALEAEKPLEQAEEKLQRAVGILLARGQETEEVLAALRELERVAERVSRWTDAKPGEGDPPRTDH